MGKSLFRADMKASENKAFSAKNAIDRLEIPRQNPANLLAMPARLFMDLTTAAIDLVIQERRAGRNL